MRSYQVRTEDGRMFRRNRKQLRKCAETEDFRPPSPQMTPEYSTQQSWNTSKKDNRSPESEIAIQKTPHQILGLPFNLQQSSKNTVASDGRPRADQVPQKIPGVVRRNNRDTPNEATMDSPTQIRSPTCPSVGTPKEVVPPAARKSSRIRKSTQRDDFVY